MTGKKAKEIQKRTEAEQKQKAAARAGISLNEFLKKTKHAKVIPKSKRRK